MTKSDFSQLIILVLICLGLFFVFDTVSVLLASVIVYFRIGIFEFDWKNIVTSFLTTGYVGGLILGVGIWLKEIIFKRRKKN